MRIRTKSNRISGLSKLLVVALLCAAASGCNYVIVFGYLLGGKPSVEPPFDIETKESMADRGVKVCVVCFAPNEVKYNFESIDYEVAQYVAFQMNSHKISVVNPDLIKAWLEENKDWDKPEEIGAAFQVTYVVYIDLNKFSIYEEGSAELFRGRAEAIVSVWKMLDDGSADKVFSKEKTSKYPVHTWVSTGDKSYQTFKGEYLTRLSDEIGRFFYEYYLEDEIASGGG